VGLAKCYVTEVDLSARTSTGDPEGEVVEELEPPGPGELEVRLAKLQGRVDLPIPAASAVKIGGERAYKLHRQGVAVEMPVRAMHVHELRLEQYEAGVARLELHVSSGTYVRAIADALGGHCRMLRRTRIGPFSVDEADSERIISPEDALASRMRSSTTHRARTDAPRCCDRKLHGVHRASPVSLGVRRPTSSRPSSRSTHPALPSAKVELLTTSRGLELLEKRGGAVSSPFTQVRQLGRSVRGATSSDRRRVRRGGGDFRFGVSARAIAALLALGSSLIPQDRGRVVDGDSCPLEGTCRRSGDARPPVRARRTVVAGDQRGGRSATTANLRLETDLACPRYGIYAGAARGHRAAVSIGTNPHYGGSERRIEPYLLDYDGDLYGQRLLVELWERLRDEAVFSRTRSSSR
jgi:hypothetical protein